MSQQVRVERELVFDNQADIDTNIKGKPSNDKMVMVDEFWYDSQANYTVTLGGDDDAIAAMKCVLAFSEDEEVRSMAEMVLQTRMGNSP